MQRHQSRLPRDALLKRACRRGEKQMREWLYVADQFEKHGDDLLHFIARCERDRLYLV